MRVAARKYSEYLKALLNMIEPDSPIRRDIEGLVLISHELCEADDHEKLDFFARVEVPYK